MMAVAYDDVVLFGDLTCDYVGGLQSFVSIKDNPLLNSFFEKVAFSLRKEIGGLAAVDRTILTGFITFPELIARIQQKSCVHPALEKSLVCVYQLACFIK